MNKAEFVNGKVILKDSKDKSEVVSLYESLYLTEKGKLEIQDAKKGRLTFSDLLDLYKKRHPNVWVRYLIYRDLREKGHVLRDGKGNVDFYILEKTKDKDLEYAIARVKEGETISPRRLMTILDTAKRVILAVVDRRNEIIYYLLEESEVLV